jgi:hypothetical protein
LSKLKGICENTKKVLLSFSLNYKRMHKAYIHEMLQGLYEDRIENKCVQGITDKEDNDVFLCGQRE